MSSYTSNPLEFSHPGFPNSTDEKLKYHSPKTKEYNCIAFALGIQDKWIDPETQEPLIGTKPYWPSLISRDRSLNAFIKLFESYGFQKCEHSAIEEEYLKIAIYIKESKVTHAARQLDTGMWVSKLGMSVDCIHSLPAINNGIYGVVGQYMKKKKSTNNI